MKKSFKHGQVVLVKQPGELPFFGVYYSEYRDGPRGQRLVCVETKGGCGVGFPVRFCTPTKRFAKPS